MPICTMASCGYCGRCTGRGERDEPLRGVYAVRVHGRLIGSVGTLGGEWWASLVGGDAVSGFASKQEAVQWVKARAAARVEVG